MACFYARSQICGLELITGKMKNFLVLIAVILTSLVSFSQGMKQTVIVTNLENVKGNLYIGWYNQSLDFRLTDKAIYREKIEVNNQQEIAVDFKGIPEGKYAIAVFVDENNNYKLDKNILGIPKEKYGFSNNVLPALRPATFQESVFEVNQQQQRINIRLK